MSLGKKRVNKKLFNKIIKEGKIFSGSFFVFRYINVSNMNSFAVVVPKKISPKAVNRNKYKRKGYYILRLLKNKKGIGIFIYKKEGIKTTFDNLKKDIIYILTKTKII